MKRFIGRHHLPLINQLVIGVLVAFIAVAVRMTFPLQPQELPTVTVVVALAVVTTFVGLWAGAATAIVGGALAFYFFFNPYSWSLDNGAWVPLVGYTVLALVILTTSALYAQSERQRHEAKLEALHTEARRAELFARELAHRLGNALTIVQSVAIQTLGNESPAAQKFAARLKALGDANKLLTEHVDTPTAECREVIETALRPFRDRTDLFRIESCAGTIPSQSVMTLALAIHELSSNAIKHGALSSPTGWVEIGCRTDGDHVEVVWTEHSGPPVKPTSEQGFGMKLLKRLGGTNVVLAPEGLQCAIRLRA